MEFYESKPIVIVADRVSLDWATAIRAGLELFCQRVCLFLCGTRMNLDSALAGQIPDCDHVIIALHGNDKGEIRFNGHPPSDLGPEEIAHLAFLPGKFVLNLGCAAGGPDMAEAFLQAGCRGIIGADRGVDDDVGLLFPLMFYAFLLQHVDTKKPKLCEREAFEAARRCYPGADIFEMYEPQSSDHEKMS